jgi:hypothetical protein
LVSPFSWVFRDGDGFAVFIDPDIGEFTLGDQEALAAGASFGPGFDPGGDRGAPDADDIGIAGDFIADQNGDVKLDLLDRDRGDATAGALVAYIGAPISISDMI